MPLFPFYFLTEPFFVIYSEKTKLAEWEEDDTYCEKIKIKAPYNKGRRLLDVMDLKTFDFLMCELLIDYLQLNLCKELHLLTLRISCHTRDYKRRIKFQTDNVCSS